MNFSTLRQRLPARTWGILLVGVLLAVCFLFVFMIPEYRHAARLRVRIDEAKRDVAIRAKLAPFLARLRKAEAELPKNVTASKPTPMPLADVDRLTELLDALAKPVGVRLAGVTPRANSAGKNGLLAVDLRLLGPVGGLHDFLLALGRFDPLVSVASATTMVGPDGRELLLKCWLAVR